MSSIKFNQHELALRMLEAAIGFRRPSDLSAEQALECGPDNLKHAYLRAAQAATAYFIECAGPAVVLSGPPVSDPTCEKVPN